MAIIKKEIVQVYIYTCYTLLAKLAIIKMYDELREFKNGYTLLAKLAIIKNKIDLEKLPSRYTLLAKLAIIKIQKMGDYSW